MPRLTAPRTKYDVNAEVIESIERLDSWVERNGWAGYDPYDLRGHPFFIWLRAMADRNIVCKLSSESIFETTNLCPLLLRKVFRIDKEINAKGMALFASAYLILYQEFNHHTYLKKAGECLEWLKNNKSQGYAGDCWGYPFNWQTDVNFPAGTPSAVVSCICGDAFWNYYKYTGESRYLANCVGVCEFLTNSLNVDRVSEDELCFSYTPLDHHHVHNANLFAAEFLIRIGKETKREQFYRDGLKALNYTLKDQTEDGAFYYRTLRSRKEIDHYHTGFVLRSLYSIYKTTGEKRVVDALSKGYRFYRDNLFKDGMIPALTLYAPYTVNIHSCAEAVLCMTTVGDIFPDAIEYARRVFQWTRDNMQDVDGHFYYLKNKLWLNSIEVNKFIKLPYIRPGYLVKIPYIRWGQAWMMRALASLATRKGIT